jgi:hypothetical protein
MPRIIAGPPALERLAIGADAHALRNRAPIGVVSPPGGQPPSFIGSHRVGLDEAPEADRRFDQRRDGYTQVIPKPGSGTTARA